MFFTFNNTGKYSPFVSNAGWQRDLSAYENIGGVLKEQRDLRRR